MSNVANYISDDLAKSISKAANNLEKKTKLSQVFLSKSGFAQDAVSTGSLWMDYIMGGGVPRGRIVGIAGPEHSGKSLISTDIAKQQLDHGRIVVLLDAEGGNDPLFLRARGIDFEQYSGDRNKNGQLKPNSRQTLYHYQPQTGEQLRDYMYGIMSELPENRDSGPPPIIFILDSVVALVSDAITGDLDSNKMAMHAKMYSEILPVIQSQLSRTGCSFVYTNQLRNKPMQMFGSPEYEPCGDALKYFSSIRLKLGPTKPQLLGKEHWMINNGTFRQGGVFEEPHTNKDGSVSGLDKSVHTCVRTIKNKVYSPHKVCWMKILFEENGVTGSGLDKIFDVFSFLVETGFVKKMPPKPGSKGKFELRDIEIYDLQKEIGIPKEFTLEEFSLFVKDNANLSNKLRKDLLESNKIFDGGSDMESGEAT